MKQAKATHDSSASQLMTTFLGTLQNAEQSPSFALDLYKKAGGNLPDAAPVQSRYEYETPTEKAEREAIDASNFSTVAIVIQIHCGLMYNAALLVTTPTAAGVQEGWIDWLKNTAAQYPQLQGTRALKKVAMRDSVISSYLGFSGWGDSAQGQWTVRDLPQLYHDLVLQRRCAIRRPPPRSTPGTPISPCARRTSRTRTSGRSRRSRRSTLTAMRTTTTVQPSMDKLAALDAIIKANPTSDHLNDWIARMQAMIDSYRRGGKPRTTTWLPGATPGTPSSQAASVTPAASPGTLRSRSTTAPTPGATPAAPEPPSVTSLPSATPGTPASGRQLRLLPRRRERHPPERPHRFRERRPERRSKGTRWSR